MYLSHFMYHGLVTTLHTLYSFAIYIYIYIYIQCMFLHLYLTYSVSFLSLYNLSMFHT